jgi:hypothetical protein
MMTAYMKTNQNSAIHLGVNPKLIQQGSDIEPEQQAQTILPKQSIEDKTITIIQTISSNEQSNQNWATLSTQNNSQKKFLRTSSASRQKHNHKKQEEIYHVYGISRPVSATVIHRKRMLILTNIEFYH